MNFISKIKLPEDNNIYYINSKNSVQGQGYGVCSTKENNLDKTAAIEEYSLAIGGVCCIKFTNSVLADSTLNISNCGSKPIVYRNSKIVDNIIREGCIATFIYDGTNYILISTDVASVDKQLSSEDWVSDDFKIPTTAAIEKFVTDAIEKALNIDKIS